MSNDQEAKISEMLRKVAAGINVIQIPDHLPDSSTMRVLDDLQKFSKHQSAIQNLSAGGILKTAAQKLIEEHQKSSVIHQAISKLAANQLPYQSALQIASGQQKSEKTVVNRNNDPLTLPTLGQLVRSTREASGKSQADFAALCGVGRRFLSELENGKPTLEIGKVMQVLAAAGIDLTARKR
jgi:y4mF family transcriptional regulator